MGTTPCSRCGRELLGAETLYTAEAAVICLHCNVQGEVEVHRTRATRNIYMAPVSALAFSVVGWIPRLTHSPQAVLRTILLSLTGISGALFAIRSLRKRDE